MSIELAHNDSSLAYFGGNPCIQKISRKTEYPVLTKEDMLQMILSVGAKEREKIEVEKLTEEYRDYVKAHFALPAASGTASLHIALAAAGVAPGDEVIVPALTFIATPMAVLHVKAIPIFADIDPRTFCMDPKQVETLITSKTKAIMPVHVHGLPADMRALRIIADKHQLKIVEDASHAHSASIDGQICGSLGDTAGQSLMADKNYFVGGEGGMAFFKTAEDYERAVKYLSDHGFQYDMSWVVASLGRSQLKRLKHYDQIRARNAKLLSERLLQIGGFIPPFVPDGFIHSYNMYRITIDPVGLGLDDVPVGKIKEAIKLLLLAEGVPAREWQNTPMPMHKHFESLEGFGKGYPWSLSDREDFGYHLEQFPVLLHVLESTLVLCREMRSPVEKERIDLYAFAFEKLKIHKDKIYELTKQIDYIPCYKKDPRLG